MAVTGKAGRVGGVISVLACLMFGMSAFMKFKGGAEVAEGMAHLGIPESLLIPLGFLELACVAVYLIPATSVLGAILLAGYVGGAILAHLRVGDPIYVPAALGVLVWLGLFLRENRLKELLSIRTVRR